MSDEQAEEMTDDPRAAADSRPDQRLPFGIDEAEYRATTETVGLADLSQRTRLELTGADHVKFVNNLCTNDVVKLPIGAGCEFFLLDVKGRTLARAIAFKSAEALRIDAEPGRGPDLVKHFEHYLITEDVRVTDRTDATTQLFVTGPRAEAVLRRAADRDLPTCLYEHAAPVVAGVVCELRRCDRSVHSGYDVVAPTEHRQTLCRALEEAGRVEGLRSVGPNVLEALRVEAGLPVDGKEVTDKGLAQELDRTEQSISFVKGCYLGQETVARLDAHGHVNKLLRGLILDGSVAASFGARILDGDKEVGTLTSCVWSPRFGRLIALAILRAGSNDPGQRLSIESDSGLVSAVVGALPFSDA